MKVELLENRFQDLPELSKAFTRRYRLHPDTVVEVLIKEVGLMNTYGTADTIILECHDHQATLEVNGTQVFWIEGVAFVEDFSQGGDTEAVTEIYFTGYRIWDNPREIVKIT